MSLRILAILPVLAVLSAPAKGAERSFPYKAYITANDVHVRSGPGQSYYPTDKLRMGQEVEVYRHDPGGWYAIRPPKGSFSWVSSRWLEMGDDGLASVIGDRVAARVGSRLSDIRDVIQVRLDRGELVEVLGRGATGAGPSASRWCKISPPPGEFRWVYGKYVDPDFPVDGIRKTTGDDSPIVQRSAKSPVSQGVEEAVGVEPREDDGPAVQAAEHSVPASTQQTPRATPRAEEPSTEATEFDPPLSTKAIPPSQFKAKVDDLELRLSAMLVEEPATWNFDGMADQADALLAQAQTALERGRARLLVKKISRLAGIKRRYDAVTPSGSAVDLLAPPLAGSRSPHRPNRRTVAEKPRYDGVGRLKRVVSSKVGAPQFALVNEQGDVTCYLTPAPDVNLRRYEGQRIGVTGVTGLMLEPRAKHVAAKHITLLDDTRLR